MLELHETLAISSLTGGKIGPTLFMVLVTSVLYYIGMSKTIKLVDRHEYAPEDIKIDGVIFISLFCSTIGAVIGYGIFGLTSSIITYALFFCGATSFLASALLLGFRLPHRIMVGFAAPVLLTLALLAGRAIHLLAVKILF